MNTYTYDAVVVGSGSAGYACAVRLHREGVKKIAVLTEGRLLGTSRCSGSDKQTYYKLSLAGDAQDSVTAMARTLFAGGSVDGDLALAEAAGSAEAFFSLVQLGVKFPANAYGEYVGYRTDHDDTLRATSAGPYTSKYMTQALEAETMARGIPVHDRCRAIRLLKDDNGICGVLAMGPADGQYTAFRTGNVVLATGGNAAIYRDVVYPHGQTGASFLALEAGAVFANAAEWQYGIACVRPRWNLSGSFQQVVPRYVSVDAAGTEHEFLEGEFASDALLQENIFLKGYEWPFDSAKCRGSSMIDLMVLRECRERSCKVYLDFTQNPRCLARTPLQGRALEYLKRSGALADTPAQRLKQLNCAAYDFFAEHGTDLSRERIEIAVCAQHNNGGIAVNANWQTNVGGLYAVGECAGTHGVYRPGGTALNAGQVGAMRAARHIARCGRQAGEGFAELAEAAVRETEVLLRDTRAEKSNLAQQRLAACAQMSTCFACQRDISAMQAQLVQIEARTAQMRTALRWSESHERLALLRLREILWMQRLYAQNMLFAAKRYGSRGAALVTEGGRILPENRAGRDEVVQSWLEGENVVVCVRPVRPIPERELWFERVQSANGQESK